MMEFEFIEYLGDGQALLKLPDEVRYGPGAIGGKVSIKTTTGENRMYRLVDAHVRTGLVILGPLNEESTPTIVEPEPQPDPNAPILHEWEKNEDGNVVYHDLGGYHDGPKCVRCGAIFCRNCSPEMLNDPCGEQTPYLF